MKNEEKTVPQMSSELEQLQAAVAEFKTVEAGLRRDKKALQRSRGLLRTILDTIPTPTMVIDRNYRITYANRVVWEMAGGQDPVAAGLKCYAVSHGRDTPCEGPAHQCPLRLAVMTKVEVKVTHTHSLADGGAVVVQVVAAPVTDSTGEVIEIIESCSDITERVRMEDALKERERLYRELIHNCPDIVWQMNPEGVVTFISSSVTPMTGYKRGELTGMPFEEFVTKCLAKSSARVARGLLERCLGPHLCGESTTFELTFCRKDGTEFTSETRAAPVLAHDDEVIGIQGITRDVSGCRRPDDELRLFKVVVENTGEAIAISGLDGRLVYVNPAYERLFGHTLEEARKLNDRDRYSPESVEILIRDAAQALARGESWKGELDAFDASGQRLHLEERMDSIHDADGTMLYGFSLMHAASDRSEA